jgi:hypothetical protein
MIHENYTNINIFKKAFEETEVTSVKNVISHPLHHAEGPVIEHQSQFNPYCNNEGTTTGMFK